MRSPLALLIFLLHALRLRWLRFRARRLLAQELPRAKALLEQGTLPALPQVVREPLEPASTPPDQRGDYPALQFGAQAIRAPAQRAPLLLRVVALPAEPRELAVLRPRCFQLDAHFAPLRARGRAQTAPERFALAAQRPLTPPRELPLHELPTLAPLQPRAPLAPTQLARPRWSLFERPLGDEAPKELSVARPELLGLDEELLPPAAREQPRTTTDRLPPPTPGRSLKPRTPLPRAPLTYLDPRAFRLDPHTLAPPNEGILLPREAEQSWLHPLLNLEIVEVRALEKAFLWPPTTSYEWFTWWQDTARKGGASGALEAKEFTQPQELFWKMEICKEQMLIRRDVAKDEQPPPAPDYYQLEYGTPMENKAPLSLDGLILPPEWIPSTVEAFKELDRNPLPGRAADEAYFAHRALIRSLDD